MTNKPNLKVFASAMIIAVVTSLGVVNPANAATASIQINAPDCCGNQNVAFTGAATYPDSNQDQLIVKLDGTTVYDTISEPANWTTDLTPVTLGSHTLTATVGKSSSTTAEFLELYEGEISRRSTFFLTPPATRALYANYEFGGTAYIDSSDVIVFRDNIPVDEGDSVSILSQLTAEFILQKSVDPSDPNFNSTMDMNGDGYITDADWSLIARALQGESQLEINDSLSFTVAACQESNGGGGDEQDCCPGPDVTVIAPQAEQIIVADMETSHIRALKPLNSIFRSAFGRNPTFIGWEYWADRLLNDKPAYDALYGAMQWQELHGQTIGN
jgi:hypothetical protein